MEPETIAEKPRGIFPTIGVFALVVALLIIGVRMYRESEASYSATGAVSVKSQDSALGESSRARRIVAKFDDRIWKLAYEDNQPLFSIAEYVQGEETPDTWTELFTVQAFPGLEKGVSPLALGSRVVSIIREKCPENFKDFGVVHSENTEITYEWETQGCAGAEDQHEIVRVVPGKDALYTVHYAQKKAGMKELDRKKWTAILSSVEIPQ